MTKLKLAGTVKESPKQIDLFEIIENSTKPNNHHSNTVELYDALPKYNWTKRDRTDLKEAEIVRTCKLRGNDYKIIIKPAIIRKRGKNVLIYPGTREEVVEDALRKFAASGDLQIHDDNAGVSFTLGQLRSELLAMGHGFNLNEIKEAIMVCRGATLEVYGDQEETLISAAFFTTVGLTTRTKYLSDPGDAKCYVSFNPLVTKSIMNLTFRQYDYKLGMALPSPLARYMFKRMSQYWVQASAMKPYTPSLVTFLRDSPRGLSDDMYSNSRAMTNALQVLIKYKVISDYDEEPELLKRKILNVHYTIRPHDDFVKMVKAANYQSGRIKNAAQATDLRLSMVKSRSARKSPAKGIDEFGDNSD